MSAPLRALNGVGAPSVLKPVAAAKSRPESFDFLAAIACVTAGWRTSRKSVDLPAPLGPATMMSRPSGMRRSKPLRLRNVT